MDPSTIMSPVREPFPNFDDNIGPRRNISVFSRRGTATPKPIFVRNARERSRADINMAGRHRKLMSRKKSSNETALYAVPPAGVQKLASLEERMATDPNNEIVSSIKKTAPTHKDEFCPANNATAIDHHSVCGGSSTRIGTWVDGVVCWEEQVTNEDSTIASMSSVSANHQTSPSLHSTPESQIRKVNSLTKILRPRPTRPVVLAPPSVQVETSPDTPTQCVAADDRSYSLGQHLSSRGPSISSKRSLSPVSEISHVEGSSACSSRSSATSVETALVVGRLCSSREVSPASMLDLCSNDASAQECDDRWSAHRGQQFDGQDSIQHQDDPQRMQPMRSSFLLDPSPTSPTWSQAEDALNHELDYSPVDRLSRILEQGIGPNDWPQISSGTLHRTSSVRKVMQPPSVAPPVPKRSRKREWCASAVFSGNAPSRRRSEAELRESTNVQFAGGLRKAASISITKMYAASRSNSMRPSLPKKSSKRPLSKVMVDEIDSIESAGQSIPGYHYAIYQEAETTEDVLLHILSSLESPKDLMNTALMNKGMYRIYKENEMYLLHRVTYNGSPALWEFGEWRPPTGTTRSNLSSAVDTPLGYMRCYRRDQAVVERLQQLILAQCQTFIRRETALALADVNHSQAQRFNDAFWRVWTFCKIFGCGKGREEDIAGQIDWLRGGVIANEDYVSATVDTNFDVYSASVLLNPPECFARGNEGGLSAAQLFDMTEIWTCMTVLLQKYHGQLELARQHGVFDDCNVRPGDFTREDHFLEEWTLHLLTLGSDVVLEMAELASINEALGFATAEQNGWTQWSPQASRRNFLKEPVSRCYEDQVAKMQQVLSDPREQAKKDLHRRRVSSLAAEIRLRRQSSDYRRLPLIDMEHERPMSMSSRQNSVRSVRSGWTDISPISPTPRDTGSGLLSAVSPIAQQWSAPRNMAPIIEERVHADSRLAGRNYGRGFADDTSLRAVRQLVSMGFPEQKAKEALRTTDMGDGLRVDRAVELLLREQ